MFYEFHWISMILWVLNSSNMLWGCAAVPSYLGQGFFHLSTLRDMDGECQGCQGDPYISLPFRNSLPGLRILYLEFSKSQLTRFLHTCGLSLSFFQRTSLETTRRKFLKTWTKNDQIGARSTLSKLPTSAESWRSRLSLLQVWKSLASLSCKDTWRTGMHGNAWQRHGKVRFDIVRLPSWVEMQFYHSLK